MSEKNQKDLKNKSSVLLQIQFNRFTFPIAAELPK